MLGFQFVWVLTLSTGYRLLSRYDHIHPAELRTCRQFPAHARQMAKDAASSIRVHDFHVFVFDETRIARGRVGTICQMTGQMDDSWGVAFTEEHSRNIYINPAILSLDNVLYNVLLHELLHVCGLAHSDHPGMMNYSVRYDIQTGRYVEDNERRWLSIDDWDGLHLSRLLSEVEVFD